MSTGKASVLSSGMVTAVGYNAVSTCAALRAGISGVRQQNLWDPTISERLAGARPMMPQWWEGVDMLAELLAPAIEECLAAIQSLEPWRRSVNSELVPLLITVPPMDRPLRPAVLEERLRTELARKLGRSLPVGSQLIPEGRTGFGTALQLALAQFDSRGMPLAVIAGVESFMRQTLVTHYIEKGRLLCGANSNGFIPGEAAAAVLVAPAGRTKGGELVIQGLGLGTERSGAGGNADAPVTGEGLTYAMRSALTAARVELKQLNYTLSDLNGERFKFKESAIATVRLDRLRDEGSQPRPYAHLELWHPIEFIGEVGAAIVPILLGWALEACRKGYAPGEIALLYASEDAGQRLAMVAEYKEYRR